MMRGYCGIPRFVLVAIIIASVWAGIGFGLTLAEIL